MRTFNNFKDLEDKKSLNIIYTTKGYPSHPIAFHPKVNKDEQKKLIHQFNFSEGTQDIIDYIMVYFSNHDAFSKQEIIENADITISTSLIEILDSYIDEVEEIDIDLVLNNILLKNIKEEIKAVNKKLTENYHQDLLKELQRLIVLQNTISQKVEKKTNYKFKE